MPQASGNADAASIGTAKAAASKPRARHRVERTKARERYDREAIHAILDDGIVAHVAFSIDAQPFVIPMLYARDGDALVVVGSNFGQQHHPSWTGNLLKDPWATVTIGGQDVPVTAQLLTGEEAAAGYRLMVELASTYDAYRGRTDRQIRVFRLTPRSA